MHRLRAIGLVLSLVLCIEHLQAAQPRPGLERGRAPRIDLFGESFDIQKKKQLDALLAFVRGVLADAGLAHKNRESSRQMLVAHRDLEGLSQDELKNYFHLPDDAISKKDRRGLRAIEERVSTSLKTHEPLESAHLLGEIRELSAAVMNNHRSPIPDVGFGSTLMALDNLNNSVGNGDRPASNLAGCHQPLCSCALAESTFWENPESIATHDLGAGFGRDSIPDWSSEVWEYYEPKTNRGANPGFEIRDGNVRAKIKFAETYSEPFAARVFHALGYNVDVTDHVSGIKLKYDRRIFREFNLRRPLSMRVRPFGLFTVYSVNMQSWYDPFSYVEAVVLKSGKRLDRQQFRTRVLRRSGEEQPGRLPFSFSEDFEQEIDHILTVPVNFQIDDPDIKSVGPWSFAQLDHRHLREVRGAALLAAWLGWFDTRFDNTRVRLSAGELKHYFSDLGGGLGRTGAAFNWKAESPNDFPWVFTKAPIVRGKGRMTTPFKVTNFHTILDNEAFKAMTTADAVWMARLIGRLSRQQIVEGLIASGCDDVETMLYAEKLVHRRNKMVHDLGLQEEYSDLLQRFDSREFNYDPGAGDHRVVDGELVLREQNLAKATPE